MLFCVQCYCRIRNKIYFQEYDHYSTICGGLLRFHVHIVIFIVITRREY